MRPRPRRRSRWLVVGALVISTVAATAGPAAAAPFDCDIGDLQPTDLDVGAVASWPGPLVLDTPTTLSLEVDLGSGIATLPGFRGRVDEVVVTLTEPGLEFSGGSAQLGRSEVVQAVTVTPDGSSVELALTEPVQVSVERPLPRILAEFDVVPRVAGELRLDTADLTARYELVPEGIDTTYETTCEAADDVNVLIATVAGPASPAEPAPGDDAPAPTTTVPTQVMGETETLPHTGPSTTVWVALILGLVMLDLGWALWHAAHDGGVGRRRVSLLPRRW